MGSVSPQRLNSHFGYRNWWEGWTLYYDCIPSLPGWHRARSMPTPTRFPTSLAPGLEVRAAREWDWHPPFYPMFKTGTKLIPNTDKKRVSAARQGLNYRPQPCHREWNFIQQEWALTKQLLWNGVTAGVQCMEPSLARWVQAGLQ